MAIDRTSVRGSRGSTDPPGGPAGSGEHQFNAPGCSCCETDSTDLAAHTRANLVVTVPDGSDEVNRRIGVPDGLRSCQTGVLDGYVVEGHDLVGAITKSFERAPAVDGIALPGMPAGSPGIGGRNGEPFVTVRAAPAEGSARAPSGRSG